MKPHDDQTSKGNDMAVFKIIYWLGIVLELVIRAPYYKNEKAAKTDQRVSLTEQVLLALLTIGGLVLPLIYSVTHWLDFANYSLPLWMGWLGAVLMGCSLFVFARAHADLKSNWSSSLEIYEGHTLVTNGIYGSIRHPMYACQWVWSIAQILLLQNWLAGPASLVVFIPFYVLRVKAEEKMMLEKFGAQYREYMIKTGRVIPRI
jgi:protein-S-isoprenylcysteine O-methyltransferase Ste14